MESEDRKMKNTLLLCGLTAALLLTAACSSSAPANANKTTNTTTTTTTTNTSNRATTPPASNTSSNTTSNTTSNTSSASDTAEGKQDFTLVNKTGVEIDKVFISPHTSNDWEEDILGRDTLPDGESVDIKFHRNEKAPIWDLRIEDKQGNSIEWENLNLLEIAKITLHYDKATGKATAETE